MKLLSELDILADIQFIDYWDAEFLVDGSDAELSLDLWKTDVLLGSWDADVLLNGSDDTSSDEGDTGAWFWTRNTRKK